MFAVMQDGNDMGVVELGHGLAFAAEAFERFGAGERAAADHFEGDNTIEIDIACLVDNAHAADAEFLQDIEAGNGEGSALAIGVGLRNGGGIVACVSEGSRGGGGGG